ncbi:MAG: hypothetical protein L7S67_00765 [Flavobacteriales bacterium]|nr:hypothetical protein [Flavobacteriales bacterium]
MASGSEAPQDALPISAGSLSKEWPQWSVFFVLTMAISFGTFGDALDNHWTTAWLLLGGASLALALTGCIRMVHPKLWAIGMAVLGIQAWRGGHCQWEVLAQLGWIWTWIWTVPNTERFNWWNGVKALPVFALLIGSVMMMHALGALLQGNWGHGASYEMKLPWAHRNIGMEALFIMSVIGGHISKKRWWAWWAFITVLALTYQVRSVLLGSACWMLYALWISNTGGVLIKRVFLIACSLFASVQIAWNLLPQDVRVREFAKMPDIVKALDVTYNLNSAESSSIRLNLWSWTLENIQIHGAGLGAWRNDAEGWVNVAVGRCGEALHRAHSEFLQWTYEIGWLPLLLMVGLCWPLRRSMGRWAWLALPFFAFTFPAERAEILWPLAMLGWLLKSQFQPQPDTTSAVGGRRLLIGSFAALSLLLGSWVVAQNGLGRIFKQSGNLKVNWTPIEETCIGLHPQDIALNHADVFRSMDAFNAGNTAKGTAIIQGHMEQNPRCISGIRVLLKLKGASNDPNSVCGLLNEKLQSTETTSEVAAAPRPPLLAKR